jgi:Transposase IS66 family
MNMNKTARMDWGNLRSQDGETRYQAFMRLLETTKQPMDWAYEVWDELIMSDALAANWSGQEETVEAKCLAHARRKFIDIEHAFPVECSRVLDVIAKVYQVEAETEGMGAQKRLECHQTRCGPVMAELREWIEEEFAERRTEPNSSLGQAFRYLRRLRAR